MDWDTDWILEEGDDKRELMHLNLDVQLPGKIPERLQKLIDGIIRAYHEDNMGMYTLFEDMIDVEAKKCFHQKRLREKTGIVYMQCWGGMLNNLNFPA